MITFHHMLEKPLLRLTPLGLGPARLGETVTVASLSECQCVTAAFARQQQYSAGITAGKLTLTAQSQARGTTSNAAAEPRSSSLPGADDTPEYSQLLSAHAFI